MAVPWPDRNRADGIRAEATRCQQGAAWRAVRDPRSFSAIQLVAAVGIAVAHAHGVDSSGGSHLKLTLPPLQAGSPTWAPPPNPLHDATEPLGAVELPVPVHDWRSCVCMVAARAAAVAAAWAPPADKAGVRTRDACPRVGRDPVPGLTTLRNFLSAKEQLEHMELVGRYEYFEYNGKDVQEHGANGSFYIQRPTTTVLPTLLQSTSLRLVALGLLRVAPDYVLVNKYEAGHGIHPHVDDSYYEDGICGVTLSSGAVLDFFSVHDEQHCYSVLLPPGAVYCMEREARYKWEHQMQSRMFDFWDGGWVPRQTRVALTFRRLTAEAKRAHSAGVKPILRPFPQNLKTLTAEAKRVFGWDTDAPTADARNAVDQDHATLGGW